MKRARAIDRVSESGFAGERWFAVPCYAFLKNPSTANTNISDFPGAGNIFLAIFRARDRPPVFRHIAQDSGSRRIHSGIFHLPSRFGRTIFAI